MHFLSETKKNTLFGLVPVSIWSFAALFAVELSPLPVYQLLTLQLFFAFTVNFFRYLTSSDKRAFFDFHLIDLAAATAAIVLNQSCYFLAFRGAPAAEVDLIIYLWPTLLIVASSFLPGEKFSISYLFSCLLCFGGLFVLLSPKLMQGFALENLRCYLLAFGAALSWVVYNLYTRWRGDANSPHCMTWACAPAAIISLILHARQETWVRPDLPQWGLLFLLGSLQMGLAFYFWEKAIKQGCVKLLSLLSYGIPLFSVALLVLFGKAPFEPRMIIAALTIFSAPMIPYIERQIPTIQPILLKWIAAIRYRTRTDP